MIGNDGSKATKIISKMCRLATLDLTILGFHVKKLVDLGARDIGKVKKVCNEMLPSVFILHVKPY